MSERGFEYELRTWSSLRALGEARLAELSSPTTSPFLSFAWLDALEQTGCVAESRGWSPLHLTLHRNGELVAFAPAYLKSNSEGEFVFDHAFARFAEGSLGIAYYPKLIVAVPFTPATGTRVLVRAGESREVTLGAFAGGLRKVCRELGLSSAHVLFPLADETEILTQHGLAQRVGVQFQWHNAGYASFDDFLARFSAKRRHQVRRERREVNAQGVDIEVLTGSDLSPALADFVYDFYRSTVDKFYWGRRYLNRNFFEEVLSRMRDRVHLVAARDRHSGRRIAGAFNLLGADTLYGRYWGALEERKFLHFEVCFYSGIDEAIRRRLVRFEPGAGGEHKLTRGFEPTETSSVHHLADARFERAVRDFLARESSALREQIQSAKDETGLKALSALEPTSRPE
ncbi:MAG: GNAT family N-acetyltransferase [Myxococcota bacterium]